MINQFDTLFLDRDGVINVKLKGDYVTTFSDFEFMPGALLAIHKLSSIFKRILIVTNQQGIAKRIMTEKDLHILHKHMLDAIKKVGGKIDNIYYCPHLASENCDCRKPKAGMIIKALQDFPDIDIEFSYLIGDSDSDIEVGKKQKLHTIKVDNKYTLSKWCEDLLTVIQ